MLRLATDRPYFVVVNAKDEAIGVDQSSGGYPYVPGTPSGIEYWREKEEAERYCQAFKDEGFRVMTLEGIILR